MKIKCPACAKVLNIPDSAAGKVVKCPCGKQLRAPAAAAPTQAAGSSRPQPAAQRPSAQRPVAQRPAAPSPGVDPGIFDELTDNDLQPVTAVAQPGRAEPTAPSSTGGRLLQQYASGDVREDAGKPESGKRPGLLIFL
ncbi:MAG: zinc-ribbon domain-containing protein, partial [Pirellulales bacterium]|nr:zinc-ribbon domain-containing protein [Pirellulales bacterium]